MGMSRTSICLVSDAEFRSRTSDFDRKLQDIDRTEQNRILLDIN